MGKTSLKTFVCSFVLSLFAILSVNKEFFGVSKPSEHEIKIPTKNISLFFKDMPMQTAAIKTIPIKKIALSVPVPTTLETTQSVTKEELIPLTFAANDAVFEQDTPPKPKSAISEEAAHSPEKGQSPPAVAAKEQESMAEKIAANYQEIIHQAPPVNEEVMQDGFDEIQPFSNKTIQASVKIIRPNEEAVRKKLKKAVPEKETVLAQAEIPLITSSPQKPEEEEALSATGIIHVEKEEPASFVIASVPDDDDEETFADEGEEDEAALPPTFKVARAAHNPETAVKNASQAIKQPVANEPENLLIPLQKDSGGKMETAEAKIANEPDSNKLAMLTGKATIRSMTDSEAANEDKKVPNSGWKTMAEKNSQESAWVAAKGTGHQRNSQLTKEKYFKDADNQAVKQTIEAGNQIKKGSRSNVKVASEIVNNLLIPIPEDILNDPNLTPQLISSDKDRSIEEQLIEQENMGKAPTPAKAAAPQAAAAPSAENKGLLKSITSIFSKDSSAGSAKAEDDGSSSFLSSFTGGSKKKAYAGKILPTEIRLAFQPGRAEISGITLKWIQAFANKTIEDDSAGLEIRIDGSSSYELQQKRLNLLHNILTNSGVDYRKINTVFTTREPNSFIIRTVRLNNNTNGGIKEDNEWQDYYRAW